MAEYIDRSLLGIGKAKEEVFEYPDYARGWNAAISIIESAPIADVEPVVHANGNITTSNALRSKDGSGGLYVNTDVMFSSKTDLWETPQDFFDALNSEFHFNLDVCALPENAKCKEYYTPEQDGLSKPWKGTCWCNPPYGRAIGSWVRKACFSSAARNTVVMLLPARTDTRWFHDYIYKRSRVEIRFVRGRLKFGGCKYNAPFPCMVVIFRPGDKEEFENG